LPRPGPWMERLKQALAFPMYAAAAWLVWVLAQQIGADAVAVALGGMLIIAFVAWFVQITRNARARPRWIANTASILALVGVAFVSYRTVASFTPTAERQTTVQQQSWAPYSAELLQSLRERGAPVFLNFTAAWCITCLANERVALSDASVRQAFTNITYIKGDWTNQDAEITRFLERFGRSGVPLYVFYPEGTHAEPIVLPQVLTPDIVLNVIAADGKTAL
jgi:thiol:disulfide interchange protein